MTYTSASPFTHGDVDIYPATDIDPDGRDWLSIQCEGGYIFNLSPAQVAALHAYFAEVTS